MFEALIGIAIIAAIAIWLIAREFSDAAWKRDERNITGENTPGGKR